MVSASNRPFIVALDDPDDFTAALSELAADAELRARIGEANRARAMQCFDEAVMFQHYARLYGGAIRDELALI